MRPLLMSEALTRSALLETMANLRVSGDLKLRELALYNLLQKNVLSMAARYAWSREMSIGFFQGRSGCSFSLEQSSIVTKKRVCWEEEPW